jgi:RNA polymerase sigma-70 factor (ECF subfamily)
MSSTGDARLRAAFRMLLPRIWRYGYLLSGEADTAQDLAQATCLRVLEKAADLRKNDRLDQWVFAVAHRIWFHEMQALGLTSAQAVPPLDQPASITWLVAQPQDRAELIILHQIEGFDAKQIARIQLNPPRQVDGALNASPAHDFTTLSQDADALLGAAPALVIPAASFAALKARHRKLMARLAAGLVVTSTLIVWLFGGFSG